ncbi:Clock-controlled pheromone ccg-4 [Lachnellula suecica]|uniref:Clock-controlled pheromone ccg-4 n=1 Tax=Lachnellula suecica TaxID=602035 RepID=A0A8T9C0G4_9HELO|nr:Clock-controlled pheromone ccg-4 [Lachnellula suecica]
MQLTNALCVLILAATSVVTALPDAGLALAEPVAYAGHGCGARGQGCYKIKRAGEALAEALAEEATSEIDVRCDLAGGACHKARMLARDLADVVAATQDDSEAYFNSLNIEDADTFAEDAAEHIKREAEAGRGCGARGQGCYKNKRTAEAEAKADAEAEAVAGCGARGQGCYKAKREADAEAEAEAGRGCGARGQGCYKEKRDLAALRNVAREALAQL